MRLFPRVLFEDALPPIALRSQVYSLVPDRTVADRQLVRSVRATNGNALSCLAGASEGLPITHSSTSCSAIQQALGLSGPGFQCQALRCRGECYRPSGNSMPNDEGGRAKLLGKLSHRAWFVMGM